METTKVTFRLTAATNVGFYRDHNEDNFIVNPDLTQSEWLIPEPTEAPLVLGKYGCAFVVADGMGGHNAGEVASAIAVDEVTKAFGAADLASISQEDSRIESFLKGMIVSADKAIRKHAKENPTSRGMGTTIILVWVIQCRAHLAWCGDSRAYIFNKNTGLNRFSKDHSYVQELVDQGLLSEEMAMDHPDSNIITRCLGDMPSDAKPDYKSYYLQPGDFILLCSDGLCGYCRDAEIEGIMLQTSDDIYACNQRLIEAALNTGGYDNIATTLFELVACSKVMVPEENDGADESGDADHEVQEVTLKEIESDTLKNNYKKRGKGFGFLFLILFLIGLIAGYLYWKNSNT